MSCRPPLLFCFLLLLLLPLCSSWGANSFYVSPTGSDAAVGSLEQPFATLMRAQQAVAAGDTVYIRGGVYKMQESQMMKRRGIFARLMVLEKSGTQGQPITYKAYQNEKPVFDCTDVKPRGQRVTAFYVRGSWLHLIGLDVTGVQVTITGHTQSICFESQGSHNILERLTMHDGQAIGIYHISGKDNLFLNCDAWNNWDYTSENKKGGNVDGFGCHPWPGGTGNVFRGCRAWFNSDDGYDCLGAKEAVVFENCWAAYNGFSPKFERTGDGNGFKAGGYGSTPAEDLPQTIPRHIVRQCFAMRNKNSGFYANHHPDGCDWINNTAYNNGANFNMLGRLADNRTDIDGCGHLLVNNLGFGKHRDLASVNMEKCELKANSFTLGLKLSPADFQSLDEAEFTAKRQPTGDLPIIKLMRPASGSPLIDAGISKGLPFTGKQPDLGAFEARK